MLASKLEVKDLIEVAGVEVAISKIERIVEDETWIYATDVNDNEYEWREDEEIEILEHKVNPYDYISECNWCERPAHVCICP